MSRHYDAGQLASYREDLVRPRTAARIRRHLSGCATCSRMNADLASVSAVLAGTRAPAMPEPLAERLQLAIASESAARSAGATAPAGGLAGAAAEGRAGPAHIPGRPDLPEGSGRRARGSRMPDLFSPLVLRGLAATAAVVVVAGVGFVLVRGQQTPGAPSGGASRAPVSAKGNSAAHSPGAASVQINQNGTSTTAAVEASDTNYTSASLASQVRTQVSSRSENALPAPSAGVGATSPANGKLTKVGGVSIAKLEGCLTRVAAGRKVLLADVARYLGKPATIIVLQSLTTADAFDVVVVGLACSSSASDIVARSTVTKVPAG